MFDPGNDVIPTPPPVEDEEPFEGASCEWDPILRGLYLQSVFSEVAKKHVH